MSGVILYSDEAASCAEKKICRYGLISHMLRSQGKTRPCEEKVRCCGMGMTGALRLAVARAFLDGPSVVVTTFWLRLILALWTGPKRAEGGATDDEQQQQMCRAPPA